MGRVALVTGGTRGIGEAISVALKEAGYNVAANYAGNDAAAQAFTERTGIPTFKFDVSDCEAVRAGIASIESDLGPVEILINNAGITRDNLLLRMKDAEFDDLNAKVQSLEKEKKAQEEKQQEKEWVIITEFGQPLFTETK